MFKIMFLYIMLISVVDLWAERTYQNKYIMLAAAFDLAFYFRLLFVIVIIYTLTLYNTEYKT